ncbi:MAG: mycofactocin biosynthesis glycosyltransferase MftF [Thermoleophilia bacterium]
MGDRLRVSSRRPARAVDLSPSVRPLLAQLAGHGVAVSNPAPGAVRVDHITNGPVPATGPAPVVAPAELQLLEYLVQRGFACESSAPQPSPHHEAVDTEAGRLPSVSCVVVVRNRPRELARCLRSLIRLDYPSELLEVLVVDDASEDATPQVARAFARWAKSARGLHRPVPNVRLQRLSVHDGIAGARNQGLLRGRGELIAFTDSDCVASPLWVRRLVSQLRPDVAAVGGGVTGLHTETALQRYEAAYSPLHMGDRPTRVGRGFSVPYLPTCNLLVRREAALAAGGFNSALQVGEDVDFCRRLEEHGFSLRYEPSGTVAHDHRDRLSSFLRRRAAYGSSEATLYGSSGGRHPGDGPEGSLFDVRLAAAAIVTATALSQGPAVVVVSSIVLGLTLRRLARWLQAGRPLPLGVVLGSTPRLVVASIHQLGGWVLRYWSLPLLVVTLVVETTGRAVPSPLVPLAVLAAVTALVEWRRRRPRLDPLRAGLLYLLDVTAYQVGVWQGDLRAGPGSASGYPPCPDVTGPQMGTRDFSGSTTRGPSPDRGGDNAEPRA